MSVEAYKIAVKIALTENVTRGLVMMAGHFKTAETSAKALQDRITAIGKMTLLGGGMVAAGGAGLKMLEEPLNKAMEYERYIANMRQQGLGDSQIQEAKKFVEATSIINTSMLDRMRHFTEAQGAFRESGKSGSEALQAAKVMMPVLSTYEVAMSTLDGAKHAAAEQAMRQMNKTVEIMGGLNDPNRAKEIADAVFKAVKSSGKMVTERDLRQLMTQGGTSVVGLSDKMIFAALEPVVGEFGGSSVGVGLQTAFNRTHGVISKPPRLMVNEMLRLGMWDRSKLEFNSQGGIKALHGDPMMKELAEKQAHDIPGFLEDMLARYKSAGITSMTDIARENEIVFGRTGGRVYTKLMQQLSVIKESMDAFDKSEGASQVANDPANKPLMARQMLEKKWEDFQLAIAMNGGLLDLATRGLTALASAVSQTTEFAKAHPMLTKLAVGGLAIVSVLAIVGGGLLMLKAAFSALALISPIAAISRLAYGAGFLVGRFRVLAMGAISIGRSVAAMLATAWPFMAAFGQGIFMTIVGPIKVLAQVLLIAGRALLLNPIGIAITAIGVAAYFLWKNWDSIKPKLMEMWEGIKAGFHNFIHGFLSGWQTLFNSLANLLNKIPGVNVSQSTIADDYAKANPSPKGGSPNIALSNGRPIQVNTIFNLDGQRFAAAVSHHQAREAARPATGGTGFDPIMNPMPVALGGVR